MATVNSIVLDHQNKTGYVDLFVDEKSDVTSDMKIDGLPDGYTIRPGSSVITSEGDIAFRKSDDTWNWV